MGVLRGCIVGVVAIAAVSGAACSGGSPDVDSLPPESDEVAVPAPSPSPTTEPTTTTPSSASTTTSTSTVPPSSTLPNGKPILEIPTEWDSELEEIFGRYLLYWEAIAIANAPPEATTGYEPLVELVMPDALEELEQQIRDKRASRLVTLVEGTVTDHIPRLPNPSVLSKVDGSEVVLQDCFVDGRIVQTEDGDIVNDEVITTLLNVKMAVLGGEWRVAAVRDASPESDGYQECVDYGTQFG